MNKWTVCVFETENNNIFPILNAFAFEDFEEYIRLGFQIEEEENIAVVLSKKHSAEEIVEYLEYIDIPGFVSIYSSENDIPSKEMITDSIQNYYSNREEIWKRWYSRNSNGKLY